MDFPDSIVLEAVDQIKKGVESTQLDNLASKIDSFTSFQRSQFFCLAKDLKINFSKTFQIEIKIWEEFDALFRSDYTETSFLLEKCNIALGLAEAAVLLGLYDLEDLRAIFRYLYTNTDDYDSTLLKLNISILRILKIRKVGSQVLSFLISMLRFFGIPLAATDKLINVLIELFPEVKAKVTGVFDIIGPYQRYPEYLEEMVEQLNYDEAVPILKDWLDLEILFKLERAIITNFTQSWEPKIGKTVDDFVENLKDVLAARNLSSIPLVFDSFIKPFSASVKPQKVKSTDLKSNIPPELMHSYVEKLAYQVSSHKEVKIQITFLGGAEIGTMAILISSPQSNLLIDYGMSVANYQIPYWHESLCHLDAILVSHAHLDHSGAIPYLFSKGYKGYIFSSGMTKNLTNFLLLDSVELMNKNFNPVIINTDYRFKYLAQPSYVYQMLDRFINVKPGKEYHITPDIVVKSFPSNHIQGSLSYLIECGNKEIFFSGDMNLDPTSLFKDKSPTLPRDADLSIIDSTYYGQSTFDAKKRDKKLIETVKEDCKIIIPAFSVGRAQEVMLKLEQAGLTKERKVTMLGMATKVARISGLKTHGHLSDHLVQPFEDEVVITGGGMLNGGLAREFTEQTKDDPNTTIILCGFLAKNSLGYRLLHKLEPNYKQKIVYTRFSGHTSSETLRTYLNSLKGQKALVHLGNLTKDPFYSEKIRKSKNFSHPDFYIPSLGSSLEI
ncbi:MAG: MBL fold metallo-hydrolase [Candidatus Heimdallarchaeota archaeon]|nr:MAG: MBL fold metallo-hydrolase [Candidatus Heimdallarchaeota archaeon]